MTSSSFDVLLKKTERTNKTRGGRHGIFVLAAPTSDVVSTRTSIDARVLTHKGRSSPTTYFCAWQPSRSRATRIAVHVYSWDTKTSPKSCLQIFFAIEMASYLYVAVESPARCISFWMWQRKSPRSKARAQRDRSLSSSRRSPAGSFASETVWRPRGPTWRDLALMCRWGSILGVTVKRPACESSGYILPALWNGHKHQREIGPPFLSMNFLEYISFIIVCVCVCEQL